MADDFNASVHILIRYPNGTQHSKYVMSSGGGDEFRASEKGKLVKHLWDKEFDKQQSKFI
jgi:hypothetical protein